MRQTLHYDTLHESAAVIVLDVPHPLHTHPHKCRQTFCCMLELIVCFMSKHVVARLMCSHRTQAGHVCMTVTMENHTVLCWRAAETVAHLEAGLQEPKTVYKGLEKSVETQRVCTGVTGLQQNTALGRFVHICTCSCKSTSGVQQQTQIWALQSSGKSRPFCMAKLSVKARCMTLASEPFPTQWDTTIQLKLTGRQGGSDTLSLASSACRHHALHDAPSQLCCVCDGKHSICVLTAQQLCTGLLAMSF